MRAFKYLVPLFLFFLISRVSFACDECRGASGDYFSAHTPGQTYYNFSQDKIYECTTCPGQSSCNYNGLLYCYTQGTSNCEPTCTGALPGYERAVNQYSRALSSQPALPACTGVTVTPSTIPDPIRGQMVTITVTGKNSVATWGKVDVWSAADGAYDKRTYNLNSSFSVTVDMSNHPGAGTIYVNARVGDRYKAREDKDYAVWYVGSDGKSVKNGRDAACPSRTITRVACPTPSCTGITMTPSPLLQSISQNVRFDVTGVSNANSGSIRIISDYEYNNGDTDGDSYTLYPYWANVNMNNHPTSGTSTRINVSATLSNSCGSTGTCTATFNRLYTPTATLSAPAYLVSHFDIPSSSVPITATAKSESNKIGWLDLYRRCVSGPCSASTAWQQIGSRAVSPSLVGSYNIFNSNWLVGTSLLGRWNLSVNAGDGVDPKYYCTGNPDCASFPCSGFYDCDSNPSDGGTDSVEVNVRDAPTASIISSATTVAPGATVRFTAQGNDVSGNLQMIRVYRRRCADASCTIVPSVPTNVDGWLLVCDKPFASSPTTSRTEVCDWTPEPTDTGTWQVAVNAWDSPGPDELICTGSPDPNLVPKTTSYTKATTFNRNGFYNCGNNDLVTITVGNTAKITGKVVDFGEGGACSSANLLSKSPLPDVSGAKVQWLSGAAQTYTSPSIAIDGSYTVDSRLPGTVTIASLGLTNLPSGDDDLTLRAMCAATSDGTAFPVPAGGVFFSPNPAYIVSDSRSVILGYKWENSVDKGWITSLDGDIFGSGDRVMKQTVPITPAYPSGYLLEVAESYPSFIFSESDIDVGTSHGDDRAVQGDGGSASSLSAAFSDLKYVPDGTLVSQDVTSLSNLTATPVRMTTSAFEAAVGASGTYTVEGGKTAVVYIEGSDDINITRDLKRSGPGAGRLVVVANGDVIIGKDVGVVSPSASDVNIQAFILTSGNIVIESTGSGNESSEKTLVVEGSLVSMGVGGSIDMQRDRGDGVTGNIAYPSLIVRYDPMYLYSLTDQEQSVPGEDYPGLFVNSIDW